MRLRTIGVARSAAVVVWLLILIGFAAAGGGARAASSDNIENLRQRALELVNRARASHGLSQLALGRDLNEAAESHARDMLRRGYYGHRSPEGESVQDRYVAAGGSRWELVAENIARCEGCAPPTTAGTVERLHQGWMNSPEHRANILRQGLTRFGFDLAAENGKPLYAVQTFAGPGTPRGSGDAAGRSVPLGEQQVAARAAELVNEARVEAGLGKLRASPALAQAARNLFPEPGTEAAALNNGTKLFEALPAGQRNEWRALSVVAGTCGGCGTQPTAADVRFFRDEWLGNPQYRRRLLDPNATALGFAVRATGTGRKTAVLVVGTARR